VVLNSGGKKTKRKQEEEKNIPKIVATFVYASSQGQRTHSARTNVCCLFAFLFAAENEGIQLSISTFAKSGNLGSVREAPKYIFRHKEQTKSNKSSLIGVYDHN
jgi:hypothetical protein